MKPLGREARAFREAMRFFTRVPLRSAPHFPSEIRWAMTYFPLVGWLVGGAAAGVFAFTLHFWPTMIASGLSLIATVVLTGALHEDGWADVCDSIGGGSDRARALAIMKDSRIGVFGAVGLGWVLALKWQLVGGGTAGSVVANSHAVLAALWCGHALSRGVVCGVPMLLPYLDSAGSKSRPLVEPLSSLRMTVALSFAMAPVIVCGAIGFFSWVQLGAAFLVMVLAAFVLGAWFFKRLGGYTGDCLGAVQQVTELAFYLVIFAKWS